MPPDGSDHPTESSLSTLDIGQSAPAFHRRIKDLLQQRQITVETVEIKESGEQNPPRRIKVSLGSDTADLSPAQGRRSALLPTLRSLLCEILEVRGLNFTPTDGNSFFITETAYHRDARIQERPGSHLSVKAVEEALEILKAAPLTNKGLDVDTAIAQQRMGPMMRAIQTAVNAHNPSVEDAPGLLKAIQAAIAPLLQRSPSVATAAAMAR